MELAFIAFGQIFALFLSIYTGVIVARCNRLSCIYVGELPGEWHEVEAKQPKTIFDDPAVKI